MTNPSAGAGTKRSRDANDEPRDWRDVHLKSRRRESPHRERARDRDRDRDRDGRKRHSHRRDYPSHSRRSSRPRSRSRSPRRRSRSPRHRSRPRTPLVRQDSEKEEGEISPPPPTPSPKRSQEPESMSVDRKTELPPPQDLPEIELDLPTSPPPIEDTLAARRARRQAILAKYAASGTSATDSSQPVNGASESATAANTEAANTPVQVIKAEDGGTPVGSQDDFSLAKDKESSGPKESNEAQISAADYDPSFDRREDEDRRVNQATSNGIGEPIVVDEEEEEFEMEEDEDDVDDMFAESSEVKEKKKVVKKKKVKESGMKVISTMTLLDSAADPEGYYQVILGEQLDGGRYQVFASVGKGMFANVVRARVLGEPLKEVAIKIVRAQESMYKSGLREAALLQKLNAADPEDKKHIVRLERTFEHRGHLCLVFESMSMNLREVIKRYGRDVGLNIRAVRAYAHQLFLSLTLLKKEGVMHADLKPDNILVNESKTLIKLCDLGSAGDAAENEITPYLVSRFYRAPEIILGIPYDPSLDTWSLGCTLYELYTGRILFPGRSNNHMLQLHMELKGRFNSKMIKKAKFGEMYFDELGQFIVGGIDSSKKLHISTKPVRSLQARLLPTPGSTQKVREDEARMVRDFVDLLEKCIVLDPGRRITPREALGHAFVRGT